MVGLLPLPAPSSSRRRSVNTPFVDTEFCHPLAIHLLLRADDVIPLLNVNLVYRVLDSVHELIELLYRTLAVPRFKRIQQREVERV
jgi:hypothetical protein